MGNMFAGLFYKRGAVIICLILRQKEMAVHRINENKHIGFLLQIPPPLF